MPLNPNQQAIDQLKTQCEQLRGEANVQRMKVSEVCKDLMTYCDERKAEDVLVVGVDASGKGNPFQEKKSCTIL